MKPEYKIKKQQSGICQMTVKGDLTAQYSKDFKEQLRKCLGQGGSFDLSLKDVTSVDVTALQLLQSFRNDLKSVDTILSVSPPSSEEVMPLLRKCGLDQIIQATLVSQPEPSMTRKAIQGKQTGRPVKAQASGKLSEK